jgi:hypothetical protein
MTSRAAAAKKSATPAKTVVKRVSRKRTPTVSPGQRLVAELTAPGDTYALQLLIKQAGHTADYLDRMNGLLNGDRDCWLRLKVGAAAVEVVVNNPLVQQRALAEQLRKLIAEVQRQRGKAPGVSSGNGDPLTKY